MGAQIVVKQTGRRLLWSAEIKHTERREKKNFVMSASE